ncbi:MAG: metallophosphoesterase family protein [Anaerovoracaceae bacterium]|jgi:exonuclease SbcD
MKIIHTADIHLDSPMTANLTKSQALQRNAEILSSFGRMVSWAQEQGVRAILISGDLFDTARVSTTSRNAVTREIVKHPEIDFFYLRGNHDIENSFSRMGELPENLHLFGEHWTTYRITGDHGVKIAITGCELNGSESDETPLSLRLAEDDINIVMLHGQVGSGKSTEDGVAVIDPAAFAGCRIDCLALGHVHTRQEGKIDVRGIWEYPGCLEGRGFDETGEHGFVVLDINERSRTWYSEFVPFASRTIYEIPVDVTGAEDSEEIGEKIEQEIEASGAEEKDLVRAVLTGKIDAASSVDLSYLEARESGKYYVFRLKDKTQPFVNYLDYSNDRTLKGEFVRMLSAAPDLSEEEKAAIIRYGITALNGEAIQ